MRILLQWVATARSLPPAGRRALALAGLGFLWFDPSGGMTSVLLIGLGIYGLWHFRQALAAWKNPAGILFGLGVAWAVLSVAWSFDPSGTGRDLSKSTPMVLAVFALPMVVNRPDRIWWVLVSSASLVTVRLALELVRVWSAFGWPEVMAEARFLQTYLYTHPNVSSMMAGLCILILAARMLAGGLGAGRKALMAAAILSNLVYLLVMASRAPQIAFVLALLAFPVLLLPGWGPRLAAAVLGVLLAMGLWQVAHRLNPRFHDQTMVNFNRRDTIWGHGKLLADRRPVQGYGFGKKAFTKAVYANPDQRAPLVPVTFPHAHSYWLMVYFQGGRVAFTLWSLGWLALGIQLLALMARADRAQSGWAARTRARLLPVLLGLSIACILVYGIVDFPDHVIRQAQFYLAGLAVALSGRRLAPAGAAV